MIAFVLDVVTADTVVEITFEALCKKEERRFTDSHHQDFNIKVKWYLNRYLDIISRER